MEEGEIVFPPVARVNICRRVDECLSIGSCDCGISLWQTERGFYGLLLFMGCLARRVKTGLLPGRQKKAFVFFYFTNSAETVIFVTLKQESNQIKKIKDRSWPKKLLKLR